MYKLLIDRGQCIQSFYYFFFALRDFCFGESNESIPAISGQARSHAPIANTSLMVVVDSRLVPGRVVSDTLFVMIAMIADTKAIAAQAKIQNPTNFEIVLRDLHLTFASSRIKRTR